MKAATTAWVFPGLDSVPRRPQYAPYLALDEVRERLSLARKALGGGSELETYFEEILPTSSDLLYEPAHVHLTAVAILCIQLGTADRLQGRVPGPDWVTGYSLGDVARTVVAGSGRFEDAVRIAAHATRQEGREKEEKEEEKADPGGGLMLIARAASPLQPTDLAAISNLGLSVSRMSPRILIITGSGQDLRRLRQVAAGKGWRTRSLIDYPVHSRHMAKRAAEVGQLIAMASMAAPRIGLFSSHLCAPIIDVEELRQEHCQSLVQPYDWCASMTRLVEDFGVGRLVNIGPSHTVSRLTRDIGLRVEILEARDLILIHA